MKISDRAKQTQIRHDPEVQQKYLKRQLESLEKDNHQSLNEVEGLISIALAAQEEEGLSLRKSRHKSARASIYSSKTNLNVLLEDAQVQLSAVERPNYFTCNADPSNYPARYFCTVCGFISNYKCIRCGMNYCSVKCLGTHKETRCLKWTA
ncbi:hypothetical protein BDF14DRAFT_1839543 [Spinellus fusiger]|nr:hypothetical protein BDF14DRAFT_1839543 [Spinellus fusiger]